MLDNRVMHMAPGEALLEVPVGDFIQRLGVGIAEAQLRLDQMAVRVAAMLSEARVDFRDAQGNTSSKSLLELGFTPTFYHFTETELEVRMTLSMKVEEGFHFGLSANVGNDPSAISQASNAALGGGGAADGEASGAAPANNDRRAVLFGAAVNIDYHRKYGFEMSGSSLIRTKMIAVPPPSAFLEALRDQARAGGSIVASTAAGGAAEDSSEAAPAEPDPPVVAADPDSEGAPADDNADNDGAGEPAASDNP